MSAACTTEDKGAPPRGSSPFSHHLQHLQPRLLEPFQHSHPSQPFFPPHTQLPVTKGTFSRWEECSVSCQHTKATSFQTSAVPPDVSMATSSGTVSAPGFQHHRDSADTPGKVPQGPEWSSALERLPNQLCTPFPGWSQHHGPLGYPMRGKDTTFLLWTSPSAGPGTGSPANSQPGEQQQSWGHQSQSCAIGSLKSQVYLLIDLFSSVKLRKTQDKHKRTSPSSLCERQPNSSNSPEQGWASAWRGKNNTQFQPECQSQLKNPPLEPQERGPAALGIASTHQHLQGFWGLQQERGCKSLCHGVNLPSNAARNDKEHLKDFAPSTKITSQSRRAL